MTIDSTLLSVHYRGKTCFLGSTYAFRFLAFLVRHPNAYLAHERLLDEVWQGRRSEAAARSTVKILRRRLRRAGLDELAEAIDGSTYGY